VGMPHVWHVRPRCPHRRRSCRASERSTPEFLTASQIFYIEEAPLWVPYCRPGTATLPDGQDVRLRRGEQSGDGIDDRLNLRHLAKARPN